MGKLFDTTFAKQQLPIRIGPDRAYPLHFTRLQLLLLLPVLLLLPSLCVLSLLCISGMKLGWNLFLLVFWALSFEMITFQPLITNEFEDRMIINGVICKSVRCLKIQCLVDS